MWKEKAILKKEGRQQVGVDKSGDCVFVSKKK